MDNKDKMQGLLNILVNRSIISDDQHKALSGKLSASAENIEYLFDLITGNYQSLDLAVNILFRLS